MVVLLSGRWPSWSMSLCNEEGTLAGSEVFLWSARNQGVSWAVSQHVPLPTPALPNQPAHKQRRPGGLPGSRAVGKERPRELWLAKFPTPESIHTLASSRFCPATAIAGILG